MYCFHAIIVLALIEPTVIIIDTYDDLSLILLILSGQRNWNDNTSRLKQYRFKD